MELFSNASGLALIALFCLQQPWRGRGGNEGELAVLLVHSGDLAELGWFNSSGTLLAVRLASDDIRSDGSLLADRKPVLLEEETCTGHCLATNQSIAAVLSADFSNATCDTWTQLSNLSVISYSPVCLDKSSLLPSSQYFCMLPSSEHLPAGIAALISFHGWQRAAVISEEESSIVFETGDLVSELKAAGVSSVQESYVSWGPLPPDTFHQDYRIVVLNLSPYLSRHVLCEAFHQSLSYVWILPGWFPHGWWMEGNSNTSSSSSCHDKELEEFMGMGVLSVAQSPTQSPNDATSVPRSSSSFQQWCDSRGVEDCGYAGYAYDAMWTVAITLNSSISADHLFMSIAESNFSGVSGRVTFDPTGYRQLGGFRVHQYRINEEQLDSVQIATLTPGQEDEDGLVFAYCCNESAGRVWPQGVPPDGSPLRELRHPILGLVVLCYSLSIAVILFAVICIIFNIWFRKKKLIKLTSPTLNHMIAIGAILMNVGSLMTTYPPIYETALSILCPVRSWLISIGWSLCLSTIAVKMWRVYIIYRTANKLQSVKQKKLKRFLHDWNLMFFIGGLVVVDVLVLIVGTAVPSSRFVSEEVEDKEFPPTRNGDGIQVEYYNLQCISETGLYWVTVLFGYKVILQISGVVLAFLTRKIEVRGLNESREVQVVMIITTPVVVVGMVLRLVFNDYLNVVGTTYGLGTVIVTGTALGIIFIPKMVGLYKNPSGELIYLSKYHHENIAESHRSMFRGGSVTSSSFISSFDPTSSLRGFFRSVSYTSHGMSVSGKMEKESVRKEDAQVVKNVHFLLPQIEEASNEANTDNSQNAADNSLLPEEGKIIAMNRCVNLESSVSSTAEEDVTRREIITNHLDKTGEEEESSADDSLYPRTTAAADVLLSPGVDPGPTEQSVEESTEIISNASPSHCGYQQTLPSVVVSAVVCEEEEKDHDEERKEEVTSSNSNPSADLEHTSVDTLDSEGSDNW